MSLGGGKSAARAAERQRQDDLRRAEEQRRIAAQEAQGIQQSREAEIQRNKVAEDARIMAEQAKMQNVDVSVGTEDDEPTLDEEGRPRRRRDQFMYKPKSESGIKLG